MHSRIIEIRNGRPFSAEETKNGVMDANQIFAWHENQWFDYIVPSESDRGDDIEWLKTRLDGVLTRDGDRLVFSQEDYDAYVEKYVHHLKEVACDITPENFYPVKQTELEKIATFVEHFDFFIYNEDEGDVMPIKEWLMSTGTYHADDDGRVFYIGKIWDYHL